MKSLLQKIAYLTEQEYKYLFDLPFHLRMKAVFAFASFFLTLIIITHLTLRYFIEDRREALLLLLGLYLFALIASQIPLLALILPKLKKYRTSFFNLSAIIGALISISGAIFLLSTEYGIFRKRPDLTSGIIWLIGVTSVYAGLIFYAKVMKGIASEKARMEAEVKVAQNIQSQLVPTIELTKDGYQVFGHSIPAYEVGGDFFDVRELSEHKMIVAVGDVSGHNIAAGLLMAICKGAFHSEINYISTLEKMAKSMNNTIVENSDKRMFVSFLCGLFDFGNGFLITVNAGHLPLLHFINGEHRVMERKPVGIAFGLTKNSEFKSQKVYFNKGDAFLFLTDGLMEAKNALGEEFGVEHIKNGFRKYATDCSPREMYENFFLDLNRFTGSLNHQDDITFLSVKIV